MSVHGTARFAVRDDLQAEKLITTSEAAAEGLHLGFWHEDEYSFDQIRYGGDLHQLIVAGTGGGKFTTALAPMLMDNDLWDSAVVVIDPKGEAAQLVGPFFQTPYSAGPIVHLLDPWDECGTGKTSVLNILDSITLDNPNYVDDARALADALIIPSGAENTHWDNAARNFLTGILLYVALDPREEGQRDLMRIREILGRAWAMKSAYKGPKRESLSDLVYDLMESKLAEGAVRRACTTIINREDKERSGIISSVERDTAWMDSPQMRRVLRGPSIDLKAAALGRDKFFVVLPPDFFRTHRAWLRLVITTFAKAFRRYRPAPDLRGKRRWRHIVIDEFANLGEMSFILNDVAVSRGYDIKYTFFIQGLAQLNDVYGDGWQTFVNNTFQRFFAVSELFTADYVSRMAGIATVEAVTLSDGRSETKTTGKSESWSRTKTLSAGNNTTLPSGAGNATENLSTSEGRSDGYTNSTSDSFAVGSNKGQSIAQIQRAILTPDEVRRVPARDQILFVRGMHPIITWRPPYWESFRSWSLPPFTLGQLLETVGVEQPDLELDARYGGWKEGLWYRTPSLPPPPEPLALPAPEAETPSVQTPPDDEIKLDGFSKFCGALVLGNFLLFVTTQVFINAGWPEAAALRYWEKLAVIDVAAAYSAVVCIAYFLEKRRSGNASSTFTGRVVVVLCAVVVAYWFISRTLALQDVALHRNVSPPLAQPASDAPKSAPPAVVEAPRATNIFNLRAAR